MTEKYSHEEVSQSFGISNAMHKDLLSAGLANAMAETQKAINKNLYGSMWDNYKPAKPKPWISRKITAIRHWLAETLVDIAEFIGGYDVRGDW